MTEHHANTMGDLQYCGIETPIRSDLWKFRIIDEGLSPGIVDPHEEHYLLSPGYIDQSSSIADSVCHRATLSVARSVVSSESPSVSHSPIGGPPLELDESPGKHLNSFTDAESEEFHTDNRRPLHGNRWESDENFPIDHNCIAQCQNIQNGPRIPSVRLRNPQPGESPPEGIPHNRRDKGMDQTHRVGHCGAGTAVLSGDAALQSVFYGHHYNRRPEEALGCWPKSDNTTSTNSVTGRKNSLEVESGFLEDSENFTVIDGINCDPPANRSAFHPETHQDYPLPHLFNTPLEECLLFNNRRVAAKSRCSKRFNGEVSTANTEKTPLVEVVLMGATQTTALQEGSPQPMRTPTDSIEGAVKLTEAVRNSIAKKLEYRSSPGALTDTPPSPAAHAPKSFQRQQQRRASIVMFGGGLTPDDCSSSISSIVDQVEVGKVLPSQGPTLAGGDAHTVPIGISRSLDKISVELVKIVPTATCTTAADPKSSRLLRSEKDKSSRKKKLEKVIVHDGHIPPDADPPSAIDLIVESDSIIDDEDDQRHGSPRHHDKTDSHKPKAQTKQNKKQQQGKKTSTMASRFNSLSPPAIAKKSNSSVEITSHDSHGEGFSLEGRESPWTTPRPILAGDDEHPRSATNRRGGALTVHADGEADVLFGGRFPYRDRLETKGGKEEKKKYLDKNSTEEDAHRSETEMDYGDDVVEVHNADGLTDTVSGEDASADESCHVAVVHDRSKTRVSEVSLRKNRRRSSAVSARPWKRGRGSFGCQVNASSPSAVPKKSSKSVKKNPNSVQPKTWNAEYDYRTLRRQSLRSVVKNESDLGDAFAEDSIGGNSERTDNSRRWSRRCRLPPLKWWCNETYIWHRGKQDFAPNVVAVYQRGSQNPTSSSVVKMEEDAAAESEDNLPAKATRRRHPPTSKTAAKERRFRSRSESALTSRSHESERSGSENVKKRKVAKYDAVNPSRSDSNANGKNSLRKDQRPTRQRRMQKGKKFSDRDTSSSDAITRRAPANQEGAIVSADDEIPEMSVATRGTSSKPNENRREQKSRAERRSNSTRRSHERKDSKPSDFERLATHATIRNSITGEFEETNVVARTIDLKWAKVATSEGKTYSAALAFEQSHFTTCMLSIPPDTSKGFDITGSNIFIWTVVRAAKNGLLLELDQDQPRYVSKQEKFVIPAYRSYNLTNVSRTVNADLHLFIVPTPSGA